MELSIFLFIIGMLISYWLYEPLSIIVGLIKPRNEPIVEEEFCVLCSKRKYRTLHLISGDKGSVCSECLVGSILLLDSEYINESGIPKHQLEIIIESLIDDEQCLNQKVEENYLALISDIWMENKDRGRQLIDEFSSEKNADYVVKILSSIPKAEWKRYEVLNWIWANCQVGSFRDALSHPKLENVENKDDYNRHLFINRTSALIELNPTKEEVEIYLEQLSGLESIFSDGNYIVSQDESLLFPSVLSLLAECNFILERYDESQKYLEKVGNIKRSDRSALLMGKIYEKRGDLKLAEEHWELGLSLGGAGIVAERLKEKLNKIKSRVLEQ